MRQCICQICVCGRHRCEHTGKKRVPFAKDDTGLPTTEHKERYRPFGFQPRQQPIKPATGAKWKGDAPPVKESTTKRDFVPFPIAKRSLIRPKASTAPKGKMDAVHTTYQKDYGPKRGQRTSLAKLAGPRKDGTMPGTLPGKMEASTTYNRCYTPKPFEKKEKPVLKECTLTQFGQPFTGQTETARAYHPHPLRKRDAALPNKGTLKPGGDFHGATTHKTDFPPKYQVPERPSKKVPRWKPGDGKFEDDTTHKHDYKCPLPTEKAVACAPKPGMLKVEGPFLGESHYKRDFPPHRIKERKLPKWHPSYFPFQTSTAPFEGDTTYRTDYEPPPEEVPPSKAKPLRHNLTLPSGPMEKTTTFMRDFRKIECPLPTLPFKPDVTYKKPEEKFVGQTITSTDYTPKKREQMKSIRQGDTLKPGKGPMDDMTMTMKDFQWLAMECPAMYIKLFGKDALPQYEFEKTEGGHDYFKRSREKKLKKESSKKVSTKGIIREIKVQ